jgi:hypothetical protein
MTEPGRRHPATMLASLHPEGALVSTTTPGPEPVPSPHARIGVLAGL